MEELVRRTRETARREGLWQAGDTIVVAASGGSDSTALLHVLHRLREEERLTLIAVHIDHGFRGAESAREAEFVRALCARLDVRCETALFDLPVYIEETGMNAQAAARAKRYAFLHEVAARHGAARIALAHHADDQAETVLMRLLRGAGAAGLTGMAIRRREKNVELIRPFLRMNKADILRYLDAAGQPYCEDSSNLKRDYFRNEIRLDILPYLRAFNPALPATLVRLADIAGEENRYLERETELHFERLVRPAKGGWEMERQALLALHVALQRRLIKLILNYLTLENETTSFERIEQMRLAAGRPSPTTWSIDAGFGISCLREYDVLRWERNAGGAAADAPSFAYTVQAGDATLRISGTGEQLRFERLTRRPGEPAPQPDDSREALFDADGVRYPLVVRNRRPGDRMSVLGLNGTKKVQDMFVDGKVAPARRAEIPLVWDADGRLLWIPGLRRSAIAPVTDDTIRLLRIVWRGAEDER